MKILQLTVHYAPNVGGVETHLTDLVNALIKQSHNVFVLTYRPLVAQTHFLTLEQSKNLTIFRIPWVAGLFYKMRGHMQFLYTVPGIFFITPFVILLYNPDVIHAQGIVAGFVGVFWGKTFNKRVVVSTHSLYGFPKSGFYKNFVTGIFKRADKVLTLSKQSAKEVESLGIDRKKVSVFTYWVDLAKFKPQNRKSKDENKFVVFFVGRLVPEKGLSELLAAANMWNKNIQLVIAGSGPMENEVKKAEKKFNNVKFLGKVDQSELPDYYNASDLVIVPSTHDEGFGRVILEALACGTPVIGSNRGAIPEAMDETVGALIDISPENIRKAVESYYKNPKELEKKSKNSRAFAEKKYKEENVAVIISAYK